MQKPMRNIVCQNHTVGEVVTLLREDNACFTDESRIKLAEWLEELGRSRTAIYEARVALAKV